MNDYQIIDPALLSETQRKEIRKIYEDSWCDHVADALEEIFGNEFFKR